MLSGNLLEFGRGEDLVVGEIGDAGEHVRIPPAQGEGNLNGLWRGGHGFLLLIDFEWRAFSKTQPIDIKLIFRHLLLIPLFLLFFMGLTDGEK